MQYLAKETHLLPEGVKHPARRFTDGSTAAVHMKLPDFAGTCTLDLEDSEHRSDLPHVREGEEGKLAAPEGGIADATQ